MIDNPRFRGMTLPQAREIEEESRGFRDLSDEQVWALRMVHAHDCTQRPGETAFSRALRQANTLTERPAELDPDPQPCDTNRYGLPVYAGDGWTVEGEPDGEVAVTVADDAHPGSAARYVFEPEIVAAIAALAERPAEPDPDPDPDLVAAFEAAEVIVAGDWARGRDRWATPTRDAAERMAAVAQARIDAAVNADRDRIRGVLEGLRDKLDALITPQWIINRVLAVVDRDTGGQR